MDLASVTRFLNGFLMIALPIILGIYLTHKFHLGWKFWFIGGAVFIISQIAHIPFNAYILNPILLNLRETLPGVPGLLVVAILLGLSAGIFETFARYGMYRWWIKDTRSWRVGILAGAGHGGAEAIILGSLVMLAFINMMAYRNIDLSTLTLTADQLNILRQQIQIYWSAPWYDSLLGAVERVFTIPFHIVASLLVMQVFTRKPGHQQFGWMGLAILYHTIMDASAVYLASQGSTYLVEAVLGGMAILDIIVIFALRQPEPEPIPTAPSFSTDKPQGFTPLPIEESTQNLENTRYN